MITEHDLQEAIAKCEGEINPKAGTCIKLASFYIIREHLFGDMAMKEPTYSYAAEPEESYESETEFAAAVKDKTKAEMMPILDELMETLQLIHPRLYECTIRKFTKKY